MTLPELRQLCVGGFPLSTGRDPLMCSLEALCTAASVALISSEIWVDGSFLTKKIEPRDVDIVVVVQSSSLPGTAVQQVVLKKIHQQQFINPVRCDSYLLVQYPSGDPNYQLSEVMRAYWIRQFCFARNQDMKGLAVIRTPLT